MIHKIFQKIETIGVDNHKLITKAFQRNLQTVECKTASIDGKVYYRSWDINHANGTRRKLSQAYEGGIPIKGTQSIINYYA